MAYELAADHDHVTDEELQKQKDGVLTKEQNEALMQKAKSCAFCKANWMRFWAHQGSEK